MAVNLLNSPVFPLPHNCAIWYTHSLDTWLCNTVKHGEASPDDLFLSTKIIRQKIFIMTIHSADLNNNIHMFLPLLLTMSTYQETKHYIIRTCYRTGGSYHSLVRPMVVIPINVKTTITKFIQLVAVEKVLPAAAINTTALVERQLSSVHQYTQLIYQLGLSLLCF